MPFRNITERLPFWAQQSPGQLAIFREDRQLCYGELDRRVWQTAQYLHAAGVRRGAVVACQLADELELLLHLLGIARLGATVFSVPRHTSTEQLGLLMHHSRAEWMVSAAAPRSAALRHLAPLDTNVPQAAVPFDIMDRDPQAPWLLIAGSGSTGRPKMMAISHRQAIDRTVLARHWLPLDSADRVVTLSSLDFTAPKHRLWEALWHGAAFGLPRDKSHAVDLVARQNLTVLHATVVHLEQAMTSLPENACQVWSPLKALTVGASLVTMGFRTRVREKLTPQLLVRYASNECGPISIACPPDVFVGQGTVGRPLPALEVCLLDDKGRPVPTGQVGQIAIKGEGVITSYWHDSQSDRACFTGEGWFLTGDLGRFAPDGHLLHLGRGDQMMIMNGINIYPGEIEQVLCAHPGVRDAVALPFRHPVHQDVPVAVVVLEKSVDCDQRALMDYARRQLGSHAPHLLFAMAEIPRNELGKLDRDALGKRLQASLQAYRKAGRS